MTTAASTVTATTTGNYCSPGCAGCGAAATPKSKRDKPLLVQGRLTTPDDYVKDDLAKRGLLTLPENYMQGTSISIQSEVIWRSLWNYVLRPEDVAIWTR